MSKHWEKPEMTEKNQINKISRERKQQQTNKVIDQ